LFIVTRFREALRAGAVPESAVVTAFSTAGRAVLFAGNTVIIAVLGLLVLRQPLMNGVAVAAAVTVAGVLAGSLILLPAVLGFTGAGSPSGRGWPAEAGAVGPGEPVRYLHVPAPSHRPPPARSLSRSGGPAACSGGRCLRPPRPPP
jgi:uncharacterized membrane protein YdfJ with MMPL/SSD domain